jgi:DNA-binding transcriptional LysR family regulator
VAFLSELAVKAELTAKELRTLNVKGLQLDREFYLVFNRRRPLSPAAAAFLQFLELNPMPSV